TIIADNYGNPTLEMHLTNQVHKDFSKLYWAYQRVTPGQGVMMGQPIRGYEANTGTINFVNNIFLKPNGAPKAQSQKGAPSIPTAPSADKLVAVPDEAPLMKAGTYYYFVSAKNSQGESAP